MLCGLLLRIIKIGWDGDDCFLDRITKMALRNSSHLTEHDSRNLLRIVLLIPLGLRYVNIGAIVLILLTLESVVRNVLSDFRIIDWSAYDSFDIMNECVADDTDVLLRILAYYYLSFGGIVDHRWRGFATSIVTHDFISILR